MFEIIVHLITAGGLGAVAGLMFAENLFPPIPSEVIMPLAGFAAARGDLDFFAVVAAGTAGAVAGAWVWYAVGEKIGGERLQLWASRHGRLLTLTPKDVVGAIDFFHRSGAAAVLFGRLLPGIRTYVSVPAGIARMPTPAFLGWTTLGSALWTLILAGAGFLLEERYDLVSDWVNPATTVVLVVCLAIYLYRVVTFAGSRDA